MKKTGIPITFVVTNSDILNAALFSTALQEDTRKWERDILTSQNLELNSCFSFPTSLLLQRQEEAPGTGEFEVRRKGNDWPSISSSFTLISVLRTGEPCLRAYLKVCES